MNILSQRIFYKEVSKSDLRGKTGIPGPDGVSEDIERFEGEESREKNLTACKCQSDDNDCSVALKGQGEV